MSKSIYNKRTNLESTLCRVSNKESGTVCYDLQKSCNLFKVSKPVIMGSVAISMLFGLVYFIVGLF